MRALWLIGLAIGCGRVGFGPTGPKDWTPVASGTTEELHAIWGDEQDVFVVGNAGVILRSGDHGVTWTPIPNTAIEGLTCVTKTGNTIIAAGDGGIVALSANGGSSFASWPFTSPQTPTVPWYAIASTDQGLVQLVGMDSWTLGSTDFGATWGPYGAANFPGHDLHAAWIDLAGDLYAAGAAGLITLLPAGVSTQLAQPTGSAATLHGLWGRSPGDLFAVGTGGAVLHTLDGGAAWNLVPSGSPADLLAVAGTPDQVLMVGSGGAALYVDSVRTTIDPLATGTTADLHAVWFSPDGVDVVAVGAGGTIVHATNAP